MAELRSVMRVFIASPGDLQPERKIAKRVCDEANTNIANPFGLHVEIVGWEETVTSFGRPQSLINQDLDQCDVFFGVVWKRWGTPPEHDSKYQSGFEEEYERAVNRRESGAPIEIGMFLKEIDEESLRDPGDQLKRVVEFRKRLAEEYKVFFETFADSKDFEEKFRRAIYRKARDWIKSNSEPSPDQGHSSSKTKSVVKEIENEHRVPLEIARFLETLSKSGDGKNDDLTALEIARVRLISSSFATVANDTVVLDVHDANLLYREIGPNDVSFRERSAFIASGLSHADSELVPFWSWLENSRSTGIDPLIIHSFVETPKSARVGAMNVASLIGIDWSDNETFSRAASLESWLGSDDADLRKGVLKYLSVAGEAPDLEIIFSEIAKTDTTTLSSAIAAYLSISSRMGGPSALEAIAKLDPAEISDELLELLRGLPRTVDNGLFAALLTAKNAKIRELAMEWLGRNNRLTEEQISKATDDPSAKVRLSALLIKLANGDKVDEDSAKKVLVKPGGARGLMSIGKDEAGEKALHQFRRALHKGMDAEQAKEMASRGGLSDDADCLIAYEERFADFASEIRGDLDDRFDSAFHQEMERIKDLVGGAGHATVAKWSSLKDGVCNERVRSLAEIVARHSTDAEDIERIRSLVDEKDIRFSPDLVTLLGSSGNLSDLERVTKLFSKPNYGANMFSFDEDARGRKQISADAVIALAGRDLESYAEKRIPDDLFPSVIKRISDKSVLAADTGLILKLLHHKAVSVRRAMALKLVRTSPKTKIRRIKEEVYSYQDGIYYYNVIFWLDFGLNYAPKARRNVADRVLASVP